MHWRNSIVIWEERPVWDDPSKWSSMDIAKLSFIKGKWNLYCKFRDDKWRKYANAEPTEDIDILLQEIDKDPTCIFWG